jgi:signal transduction histidine kinase
MSVFKEQTAAITDRQRLWEVRKYCQIRPGDGHDDTDGAKSHEQANTARFSAPDAALSALLRILMDRLHADIAMLSLLDERTQFFVAGARKDNSQSAFEATKWFGCDQVAYHGGLCERTITMDNTEQPAVYEELDMTVTSWTQSLPFVDGTLAKFRSYAGAPVKTSAGHCIGTVFVMSDRPSSGLDDTQRQLLTDTAESVMLQLTLTLRALEGERLMQFQSATAALLQRPRPSLHKKSRNLLRKQSGTDRQPTYILEVYQHAAEVMRRSLQLDGVLFQHVRSEGRNPLATSGNLQDSTLATSVSAETSQDICLSDPEVDRIVQTFTHGSVLYHLDGEWLMSTSEESRPVLDPEIRAALDRSLHGTKQLLVMPLFDVLHNRTAAVCLGWLNDYTRVYSDKSDLPFVSAFCMSTMSEVLRLETHMLDRVKSDFLGSVSHEMKTPLHQTLGNLELLLQTSCSDEQTSLAINARFGTTQLLETIDKILLYASISSESDVEPDETTPEQATILSEKEAPHIIGPRVEHIAGAASSVDLIRMCEEVVEDTTKRMRLLETIMSPMDSQDQERDGASHTEIPAQRASATEKDPFTIVVFDSSPIESMQIPRNTGFRIILENLLVCRTCNLCLMADTC